MINRLRFTIDIRAEKNRIWKVLWDDSSYRAWVSVFYEGSYALTDSWAEGSTVQFLTPDKKGIYSIVEKHIPNKIMMFKHLGNVVDGVEQPIDEETKKWSGALEIYTLNEGMDCNTLVVEIDVMDEHLDYMTETFPKALEKVKSLCG